MSVATETNATTVPTPNGETTTQETPTRVFAMRHVNPVHEVAFDPEVAQVFDLKKLREGAYLELIPETLPSGENVSRAYVKPEAIEVLARDIRANGQSTPVIVNVRKLDETRGYPFLVAGANRRAAVVLINQWIDAENKEQEDKSKHAKHFKLKAIVHLLEDSQAEFWANWSENNSRQELSVIDRAMGFARAERQFGLSQMEIAAKSATSQNTVSTYLNLVRPSKSADYESFGLIDTIKLMLVDGVITLAQAKLLCQMSHDKQEMFVASAMSSAKVDKNGVALSPNKDAIRKALTTASGVAKSTAPGTILRWAKSWSVLSSLGEKLVLLEAQGPEGIPAFEQYLQERGIVLKDKTPPVPATPPPTEVPNTDVPAETEAA